MRFLLIRGSIDALAARCDGEGAVMLQVSQRLRWTELAAHSCFVIPLQEAAIGT
jgi:cyclic beta-1,2-glucan synthetase